MSARCPRANACAHGAELRVGRDGRCADCGSELTDRRHARRASPGARRWQARLHLREGER